MDRNKLLIVVSGTQIGMTNTSIDCTDELTQRLSKGVEKRFPRRDLTGDYFFGFKPHENQMIPSSGGGDGGARLLTFNVNNQESYDFLVEDILNVSQNSYLT